MSTPRPPQFLIPWARVASLKGAAAVLLLWILIIFLFVVGLAVLVSPPSPEAPRGLPQNRDRYRD